MSAPHQGLPVGGADLLGLLSSLPDVFAPEVDQRDPFNWTEDQIDAYDATPAAEFTAPSPAAATDLEQLLEESIALAQANRHPARSPHCISLVPKKLSLRDNIARVEFIASTIERLDDEELTEDVRNTLSAELIAELAGTREKVDAVSDTLDMWDGLIASANNRCERLMKRAEFYARQIQRLEKYVLDVLAERQINRLDGETSTLQKKLNPPAVHIDEGTELSHEFLFYPEIPPPPPPRPDRKAIAKALKAKRRVPGCRLEQGARLVRS